MVEGKTHLRTWVDRNTRQRFAAAASEQGLSESALLKRLVEQMLAAGGAPTIGHEPPEREPRDLRVCARLMSEDLLLLRERSAARGMPPATYVSALVRAHLRSLPPLPIAEHRALKMAINELTAVGRNLNQIARIAHHEGKVTGLTRAELRAFLELCDVLRNRTKALLKANAESWKVGAVRGPH